MKGPLSVTRPRRPRGDSGFTVFELATAMMLFGLLCALGVGPWRSYTQANAHRDAAREVVSVLRNAQVKASAEQTTYRVDFLGDGQTLKVWRLNGSSWVPKQTVGVKDAHVRYDTPSFDSSGSSGPVVYFHARGTASKGDVRVVRDGDSKVYTISVEGLTARVSQS